MPLIDPSPNNCLRNKTETELEQQLCCPKGQDNQEALALAECPPGDGILQNIGYGDATDALPYFGNVSIENSTDVHIGDKNVYHGAVTIRQIVYASVLAPVSKEGEESPVSAGYCTDGVGSNRKVDNVAPQNTAIRPNAGGGKGIFWLRDVSKRRPRETAGCCILVLLIFIISLLTSIFVKQSAGKPVQSFNNNELASIQPIAYTPDITVNSQRKNTKLRIASRNEWVGQPPTRPISRLITPVPYVIIDHTATENCSSQAQCVLRVRILQTFFIESMSFPDIGYNFLVGGDGAIYEGRGWEAQGEYLAEFDSAKSIGIAFIGTFIHKKPPEIQILICQRLIEKGLELGFIRKDYKLMASKRLTENSGTSLLEEIKTWAQWTGNS